MCMCKCVYVCNLIYVIRSDKYYIISNIFPVKREKINNELNEKLKNYKFYCLHICFHFACVPLYARSKTILCYVRICLRKNSIHLNDENYAVCVWGTANHMENKIAIFFSVPHRKWNNEIKIKCFIHFDSF